VGETFCFLLEKHHKLHQPCHAPEQLASWATLFAASICGHHAYHNFLRYRKDAARWRLLVSAGLGAVGVLFLYGSVTFLLYPR
jgi:hypothetical protein